MWIAFLLLLPLPLSVHAEDLGELSTNPVRLSSPFGLSVMSGFSGLFRSSGFLVSLVFRSATPMNGANVKGNRE